MAARELGAGRGVDLSWVANFVLPDAGTGAVVPALKSLSGHVVDDVEGKCALALRYYSYIGWGLVRSRHLSNISRRVFAAYRMWLCCKLAFRDGIRDGRHEIIWAGECILQVWRAHVLSDSRGYMMFLSFVTAGAVYGVAVRLEVERAMALHGRAQWSRLKRYLKFVGRSVLDPGACCGEAYVRSVLASGGSGV